MLITDFIEVGNRMLYYRTKAGMTQADAAEGAGVALKTYTMIERGHVNMRTSTMLGICTALDISPDDLFIKSTPSERYNPEIFNLISKSSDYDLRTLIRIIDDYLYHPHK